MKPFGIEGMPEGGTSSSGSGYQPERHGCPSAPLPPQGVRTLKLFAWEPPFVAALRRQREAELRCLWRSALMNSTAAFCFQARACS